MKKNKYMPKIALLLAFLLLTSVQYITAFAQDYDDQDSKAEDEYGYVELQPIKEIMLDATFGSYGTGITGGFRYDMVSLSVGLTGFSKTLPGYLPFYYWQRDFGAKKPNSFVTETSLLVSIDAGYHYQISNDFSAYGTLGFYTEQDSVFALPDYVPGDVNNNRYAWKAASNSGISWGLGVQYYLEKDIGFGLGYHSKNGLVLQVGYFWR
jgi:opacity protein-like surface antigen